MALKRTPLYDEHVAAGAKLVDFHGWEMPLHYGSQVEEHQTVRSDCGLFDVSHMAVVDVDGADATAFLRYLLANDVGKIGAGSGRALYSCMCNADGGVIDDLIVYAVPDHPYRVVLNASRVETDLDWMRQQAEAFGEVAIRERSELALIAVQGPQAPAKAAAALGSPDMGPFCARMQETPHGELFVATTGYTGEAGYEIAGGPEAVAALWQDLVAAGAAPCGLGARDTLRLEAGLNLYGNEMDEEVSPLEANLSWTVAFEPTDRNFIGRAALEAERAEGPARRLVGLVLEGKGVLRSHQAVTCDGCDEVGEVTSGTYSPFLERGIAMARVPAEAAGLGTACRVAVRNKELPARQVKLPFVKSGQANFEL
jgi:aminomethyltransferase